MTNWIIVFIAGVLVGWMLCSVFWILQKPKQSETNMLNPIPFIEIQKEPIITLCAESAFTEEDLERYGEDTINDFAKENIMRKMTNDLENYVRFETYKDPYLHTITLRGFIRIGGNKNG